MKIPALFHGTASTVMARARKVAAMVAKGTFSGDLGPLIDTREHEGLLMLEPAPWFAKETHFHCYAITRVLAGLALKPEQRKPTMVGWLRWSLRDPWAFLGILGEDSMGDLSMNSELWEPYLRAAVGFWPILNGEGHRYGPHTNVPRELWEFPTNIRNVLVWLGLPPARIINQPLPKEGLPGLAAETLAKKEAGA